MVTKAYFFDAYGTLFDVHSAVRAHADAIGPDAAQVSEIWRQKQLEFTWTRTLMGRYRDFWELTQEALDHAFAKVPSANTAPRKALLDAYFALDAFDEVADVLAKLKAKGAVLGILSNGSTPMLEAAVKSAGIGEHVDHVISVDRIEKFKALPEVYQMVLDDTGLAAGDISFQSSNRWDIAGAHAFGFKTVWINRGGQPDEYSDLPPDRIVNDLTALL
ncbi:haloacid dehalogenase type II [Pseudahrensia aquimaris]|uniref:(S)-2-haloacid dehalogenase n=1 Tax=Pseudahrensia aquimaris TaxID=744461 RepID=A0ABW3FBR2_9HYPH